MSKMTLSTAVDCMPDKSSTNTAVCESHWHSLFLLFIVLGQLRSMIAPLGPLSTGMYPPCSERANYPNVIVRLDGASFLGGRLRLTDKRVIPCQQRSGKQNDEKLSNRSQRCYCVCARFFYAPRETEGREIM